MEIYIKTAEGWKPLSAFGITITGGIESAICAGPIRGVYTNEWAEYNGMDVDLSDAKCGGKSVSLSVAYASEEGRREFIRQLFDSLYNDFSMGDPADAIRTLRWRFSSETATAYSAIHTARLTFADDFPFMNVDDDGNLVAATYDDPDVSASSADEWSVTCMMHDGSRRPVPLSYFGATPVLGAYDDIVTFGTTHGFWVQEQDRRGGAMAYGDFSQSARDVALSLCMAAGSLRQLWHNVDALAYFLTRPDFLILASPLDRIRCYYEKMTAKDIIDTNGGARITITLTLKAY